MKANGAAASLHQSILVKETELKIEKELLRLHYLQTTESLKPLNLIKSTIREMISSPELKSGVANAALGFTGGLIAKKIVVGNSHNPFTRIIGSIVEMVVAGKVSKNGDGIRSVAATLLEKLFNKGTKPGTA